MSRELTSLCCCLFYSFSSILFIGLVVDLNFAANMRSNVLRYKVNTNHIFAPKLYVNIKNNPKFIVKIKYSTASFHEFDQNPWQHGWCWPWSTGWSLPTFNNVINYRSSVSECSCNFNIVSLSKDWMTKICLVWPCLLPMFANKITWPEGFYFFLNKWRKM